MSLWDEFSGEGDIPDKISGVVKELDEIKLQLDKFEVNYDRKYMQEAAGKIKTNAPLIKALGTDQEFNSNDFSKRILKKCREEMKSLFDRAKKLKTDAENKKANDTPTAATPAEEPKTSSSIPPPREQNGPATSNAASTPASAPSKPAPPPDDDLTNSIASGAKEKIVSERANGRKERIISSTPAAKPVVKKGKDIWQKILQERAEKGEDKNNVNEDFNLVVLGEKNSGKSTLIHRIQDKSEVAAPSGAMEYSYARRTKKFSTNQSRDVIHTWEVSSTSSTLSDTLDIILTSQNIANSAVVVVLDLSKPSGMLDELAKWLEFLKRRVDECLKELRIKSESVVENLRKKANYAIDEHPDKTTAKPIGIPVILVGTKYDLFQDMDNVARKVVCKSLRFVAQQNCCSLVFVSKEEEALITKFRGLLNFFMFQNNKPVRSGAVTEYTKPVVIPSGTDSFDSIGAPPVDVPGSSQSLGFRLWRDGWNATFPPTEKEKSEDTFVEDSLKFQEPVVDAMRAEKEKVLERYKKESGFRARASIFTSTASSPSAQYERALSKQGRS